jgi:hypothetical protein
MGLEGRILGPWSLLAKALGYGEESGPVRIGVCFVHSFNHKIWGNRGKGEDYSSKSKRQQAAIPPS